MIRTLLKVAASGVVGYWAANKFIIKNTPDDTGFVDAGPGPGMDDAALGVSVAVTYWLLDKLI